MTLNVWLAYVVRVQRLWIPGKLPSLNELLAWKRQSRGRSDRYAEWKKTFSREVALLAQVQKFKAVRGGRFRFVHHEADRRRDPDNFCGGSQKVVLDALVGAGLLPNDGWGQVYGISHEWVVDKSDPGVEVFVEEDN